MSRARRPEDSPRHVVTPVSVRAIRRDELLFYPLTSDETARLVRAALEEDGAFNDITTLATLRSDRRTHATLVARQPGVIAGVPLAIEAFRQLDESVTVRIDAEDGTQVGGATPVLFLTG